MYATEEEFWTEFRMFNGFFGNSKWQDTKAAKAHIDEFGCTVSEGDVYFTRDSGQGYTKLKMSRTSMEQMLIVFFQDNQLAKQVSETLIEARHEAMATRMEGIDARRNEALGVSKAENKK
jgi:hypothetical protein